MSLSWDPVYDSQSVAVLLAIAIVALLLWVTPSGTTPYRRRILLLLRGLAAIALVLTLVRPALVQTDNRPTVATLVIAADSSRSMTLASGELSSDSGSQTRWEQQRMLLESLARQLGLNDERLNVALFQYDQTTSSIGGGPVKDLGEWIEPLSQIDPAGNLTDLAGPLQTATDAARTTPLAGVVLFGDGTQTFTPGASGEDDLGSVNIGPMDAAKLIGAMGVPLWTVALGPDSQAGAVRDVAVVSLPETYRMFSGNETEIAFEVAVQGYPGRTIPITLTWVNQNNQSTIAASRTLPASGNRDTVPLRVPLIAPEAGTYRLIVQAESPAGETDTSNDRQLAFVDVRSGGGRVLYLEGTPRLEQMFLRRAVRRFPDLELAYRWIPRDTSSRWPIDLSDDLQPGRYDIVILGDLHSAALGEKQLRTLAEMVNEGTALLTLGGEHAYGPGGYADSPLAQVLPVEMDASVRQSPGPIASEAGAASDATPGQIKKPFRLNVRRPHPITTIVTGDSSWTSLPEMPGANRWTGVRVAPGVQVLLDAGKQLNINTADDQVQPMMVIGEYGQGRVASVAFDSTWTWWRGGANEFHRRYWRQLMLWLLSREETDEDQIRIEMSPRRFIASEGSAFTASVTRAGATPTNADAVSNRVAEIQLEDGTTQNVPAQTTVQQNDQSQLVRISGSVPTGLPPGIHSLKVSIEGTNPMSSTMPFQVIDDTREFIADAPNHALLGRLASATSAAGGESFRADQIEQLAERITDQRRRAQRVVIEKKRLGDDPITGWMLFVLFAGSLSIEWYLRRQWGLA
ncbi:VWA domain-containing protein [Neorhodopirellula pilleata]|uniref:VWFA domain-containing protein n=1 Tax=Neorhodopirellula pilleata TaxID=2714738 RepID=A0A5C6A7F7_9BACT|nr:VWA domain-containing protein [Neorhodopirellula pilleata]TWT95011.1 hypothetical protein Pla100_35900 [Neorhodopirellula pilleata]